MAESKTEFERRIRSIAEKQRREATARRNSRTKEITVIWNDNFKRMKQENDDYQRRNADTYAADLSEIKQRMEAELSTWGRK